MTCNFIDKWIQVDDKGSWELTKDHLHYVGWEDETLGDK